MGKRSRKKVSAAPQTQAMARGYARSRERDEAVRQSLEPLGKDERPGAVTIAAVVAFVMAIANIVATAFGASLGNDALATTVFSTAILLACAGGMWFGARYWAVLGFMVVLIFQIMVFSIALIRVERWWVALLIVAVVGLLGWLFYKLIRALARIQMPERPLAP